MKIYYFTGTGNSLEIAKQLTGSLENAELLPIPKRFDSGLRIDSDAIIFVYPVFGYGPPAHVQRFISSITFLPDQYVASVAGCGGTPGGTSRIAVRLVRKGGGNLAAGYVIKTPNHTYRNGKVPAIIRFMRSIGGKQSWKYIEERVEELAEDIKNRKTGIIEVSAPICNTIGNLLNKAVGKAFAKIAQGYRLSDACTGCGTCEKICPVENIRMENGKPSWGTACAGCNGCLMWCPNSAIHPGEISESPQRSHNENITLPEMVSP